MSLRQPNTTVMHMPAGQRHQQRNQPQAIPGSSGLSVGTQGGTTTNVPPHEYPEEEQPRMSCLFMKYFASRQNADFYMK